MRFRHAGWLLLACFAAPAAASTTVRLPGSLCPGGDEILQDGFEAVTIPADPSHGSGGSYPGNVTRTVTVPIFGPKTYYLHLPPDYDPTHPWPLLLTLHGSAASAASAAQLVLADWAGVADANHFIAIAAVANGTNGGWGGSDDVAELQAILADVFASYNVEKSRVLLWGFSAGGHFGHWYALNNTDVFAAYGVSAGALQQFTCTDSGSPDCQQILSAVARKIPVDIHIGNADPLYTYVNVDARHDGQRFESGGWIRAQDLFFVVFAGGHGYTIAQLGQIWNNLCPFALGP